MSRQNHVEDHSSPSKDIAAMIKLGEGLIDVPLFLDLRPGLGKTAAITIAAILAFPPFVQWCNTLGYSLLDSRNHVGTDYIPYEGTSTTHLINLRSVTVTDLDWFGPTRLGFVKFNAQVEWTQISSNPTTTTTLPGIVFCRGGAVGILVILESDQDPTQRWVVLTRQPRVPIGSLNFLEIPAGMLDGEDHFVGVAARELQEECGIYLQTSDLIHLTSSGGLYPSPGGCDESLELYATRQVLPLAEIQAMQDRVGGLEEEGERIRVHLVKYEELWHATRDMKSIAALYLYEKLVCN